MIPAMKAKDPKFKAMHAWPRIAARASVANMSLTSCATPIAKAAKSRKKPCLANIFTLVGSGYRWLARRGLPGKVLVDIDSLVVERRERSNATGMSRRF
jgi:hypothetical protein